MREMCGLDVFDTSSGPSVKSELTLGPLSNKTRQTGPVKLDHPPGPLLSTIALWACPVRFRDPPRLPFPRILARWGWARVAVGRWPRSRSASGFRVRAVCGRVQL